MHSVPGSEPPRPRLAHFHPALQWGVLLALSFALFCALEWVRLPAAALIGPMIAAVIVGTNGATVRVATWLFAGAQAIVGVLIAGSIELEILRTLSEEWPLFLFGALSTVAASSFLGWQISRWKILPGSTAIWGSAPGAATAMVLMAGAFGADFRLVAFMQYLRMMLVAIAVAVLAAFLGPTGGSGAEPFVLFMPVEWPALGATVAVSLAGAVGGRLLRLPSPYFLGVMILAVVMHLGFDVAFQLPPLLLMLAYALIGWSIGLNFNREVVRHAARALPQVAGSIIVLLLFCAGIGYALSRLLGIDFLTALLATSPGGMDAVAIIAAASSSVNVSFIMAMQMARFLFVLLFGPMIARALARTTRGE